jgi:hypothetical protein
MLSQLTVSWFSEHECDQFSWLKWSKYNVLQFVHSATKFVINFFFINLIAMLLILVFSRWDYITFVHKLLLYSNCKTKQKQDEPVENMFRIYIHFISVHTLKCNNFHLVKHVDEDVAISFQVYIIDTCISTFIHFCFDFAENIELANKWMKSKYNKKSAKINLWRRIFH